jgi:hypothetical protein
VGGPYLRIWQGKEFMVSSIAVCGDSFGCGNGLPDNICYEKSFGGLVAEHYRLPLHVYARSGCCNFVIYLQTKKIIEQYKNKKEKPFVLITTTHHSRFVMPVNSTSEYREYNLSDVDYLRYPPYNYKDGTTARPLEFELSKKPKLISETISNFIWYSEKGAANLEYLFDGILDKIDAVKTYFSEIYDDNIKQEYDSALILKMHIELKESNIDHIIMDPNKHQSRFIAPKNYFHNDWGYYSRKFPDKNGSGHCDERGHQTVAYGLIKHIGEIK